LLHCVVPRRRSGGHAASIARGTGWLSPGDRASLPARGRTVHDGQSPQLVTGYGRTVIESLQFV